MLKLERRGKSPDISVRLREREPFFNGLLWKALLIAVGIHVGAILVFHVRPFIIQSTFIYLPVQVQSDRPNVSRAQIVDDGLDEAQYVPAPPLELLTWEHEADVEQPIAFSDLIEDPEIHYSAPPSQLMIPAVQLHISGELGQRALLKHDGSLDQLVAFNPEKPDPKYVTYHVRVEELTGKVFWFERVRSSRNGRTDELAEKILLNLEFEPGAPFRNAHGTIDFVLNL